MPVKNSISKGMIQVAGIIDDAEAGMLIESGVHYLGFPLRLPVHREDITDEDAGRIIQSLRPPCYGVLITYLNKAEAVLNFCRQLGARMVQLHGDISPDELARLRKLDAGLCVIKSLVVEGDNLSGLEAQLSDACPYVDAFITDTYDPQTGARGATGMTHNWDISRRLVSISPMPVILAGGLNPANVREAIRYVRPAGVDVHTGVESASGRKDARLVRLFVEQARHAFAHIGEP